MAYREKRRSSYIVFLDLEMRFHPVPHKVIWYTLGKHLGIHALAEIALLQPAKFEI